MDFKEGGARQSEQWKDQRGKLRIVLQEEMKDTGGKLQRKCEDEIRGESGGR